MHPLSSLARWYVSCDLCSTWYLKQHPDIPPEEYDTVSENLVMSCLGVCAMCLCLFDGVAALNYLCELSTPLLVCPLQSQYSKISHISRKVYYPTIASTAQVLPPSRLTIQQQVHADTNCRCFQARAGKYNTELPGPEAYPLSYCCVAFLGVQKLPQLLYMIPS